MPRTLEEVLADWSEQANVLRKRKHAAEADSIDEILGDVRAAAEDHLTWLSEREAMLRSGHSASWLRSRFSEWLGQGHARRERNTRYYRAVVIPQRTHPSAAAESGRHAAEQGDVERSA